MKTSRKTLTKPFHQAFVSYRRGLANKTLALSGAKPLLLAMLVSFLALTPPVASGFSPEVLYVLIGDSRLTDECPICGRAPLVEPLSGTFWLRTVTENSLVARYEIHDVMFNAGSTNSARKYHATGSGTVMRRGIVTVAQHWYLELEINDGQTTRFCQFSNPDTNITAEWPDLEVTVVQTNGTPAQNYELHLIATPTTAVPLQMAVTLDQTAVTLQWPTNASSCKLESSLPFRPNQAWQAVTNQPKRLGVCFSVTLPVSGPGKFFRLRCN